MAYCAQCGARNDEGHAFCPSCGAAMTPASALAGPASPVAADRAAPVRRRLSRPVIAGGLVVVLAAALVWFFYFRAADPAQYRAEVLKQARTLQDGLAVLESGFYSLQNDDPETANAEFVQTREKMSEAMEAMSTACNAIRGLRAPSEYADVQAKLRVYADWWVESGASSTSSALGRIQPPFTAQEVSDELAKSGLASDEVAGYMATFIDGCLQIDVIPR